MGSWTWHPVSVGGEGEGTRGSRHSCHCQCATRTGRGGRCTRGEGLKTPPKPPACEAKAWPWSHEGRNDQANPSYHQSLCGERAGTTRCRQHWRIAAQRAPFAASSQLSSSRTSRWLRVNPRPRYAAAAAGPHPSLPVHQPLRPVATVCCPPYHHDAACVVAAAQSQHAAAIQPQQCKRPICQWEQAELDWARARKGSRVSSSPLAMGDRDGRPRA